MKFATKLILAALAIVLGSGVVIAYFINSSNIQIVEKEVRDKLEDAAVNTMDNIDRMLFERYTDIKELAFDPVISSRSSAPKQIAERLIDYKNRHKIYASLSFFNLNRVGIADTGGAYTGKQHSFSEYWPEIAQGKEIVLNISKSEALKEKVFHFAHIVKDKNGVPFGVVVSRMPVGVLYGIVRQTSLIHREGSPVEINLADRDGMILYSNYNYEGILKDKLDDWDFIKKFFSQGQIRGSERHRSPGKPEEIIAFAREQGYMDFEGNGWILVLDISSEDAFAPVVKLWNRITIIVFPVVILVFFIIFVFSRKITEPIKKLGDASAEIGRGNLHARVKIESRDEIGQLAAAFNQMAENLERYSDERKIEAERVKNISLTDELTGLYNRRGFFFLAQQQLEMAKRINQEALLLFADLDDLKQINDNLGHEKGDMALIGAANVLKDTFRDADIIARIGGDEFAVFALKTPESDADLLTKRLHENTDAYNGKEKSYRLSLSVGTVLYDPAYPLSIDELLSRADKLMYKQKQARGK